jgi:hypothetical protein
MIVLSIDWWVYDEEIEAIKVHAMIEDAVMESATYDGPEIYRAGLCEAIIMTDRANWPKREVDQVRWLEDCHAEWTVINDGGW